MSFIFKGGDTLQLDGDPTSGRAALPSAMPKLPAGVKPTYPVVVDWSHGMARDLIDVWLFQRGNNGLVTAVESGGNAPFVADHASFNGSSQYLSYPDSGLKDAYDGLSEFTVFLDVYIDSINDDEKWVWKSADAGCQNGWTIAFDEAGPNGTKIPDMFVRHTDGSYERSSSNANPGLAVGRHKIVGTFSNSRAGGDKCRVWANGVDISQPLQVGTSVIDTGTNTAPLVFGRHNVNTNQYFDGNMYAAMTFARTLTDDEIRSLTRDPYQFLKPAGP